MFFSAHGNVDFMISNSCVINSPKESFNKEGIGILFNSIFSQVKKDNLTTWTLIELLREDAFATPEAMDELVKNYERAVVLGCIKFSAVCSNCLQEDFLTQVANRANIKLSFYQTANEAYSANQEFLST